MEEKILNILIIEDNPGDVRLLMEMLKEESDNQCNLECFDSLSKGLDRLSEGGINGVLLDLSLPDSEGLDTFVTTNTQAPEVPIIVLTGLDDKELATKAVRHGAQDYLVKGKIDGNLLMRSIRYAIDRKQVGEELRKHRDHLEELVEERTAELTRANQLLQEEISERMRTEEALKIREEELELNSKSLEEANTTLKVLLKLREKDKIKLEQDVLSNTKELIVPFIEKLKTNRLDKREYSLVNALESNINNIISPFLRNITLKHFNLTPKEIHVANLVKDGNTTKEIAELLNLSMRAIEFHRDNIRKKLGLNNKKVNLRSYLLSLS